jgi:uncharacterized protein
MPDLNTMKLTVFLTFLCINQIAVSQNYIGLWKGEIKHADSIIHIRFNVMMQEDSAVYAMMQEPYFTMFCDSTYRGDTLHLKSTKLGIAYKAAQTKNLNQLTGQFYMSGKSYKSDIFRGEQPIFRPQTPQKPYPYHTENVAFENKKDTVKLFGTLTIPNTNGFSPAAILISGGSQNDRDYESFYHKYFLVLADFLTRNGIAVLRYDDRGVNKSTGNYYQSTLMNFAEDIEAGLHFLKSRKEIDINKIGLIGHSEGALVASITASQNRDVHFIVLLASPGINLRDLDLINKRLLLDQGNLSMEKYQLLEDFQKNVYVLIENNIDIKSAIDSLSKFRKKFYELFFKESDIGLQSEFQFNMSLKVNLSPHNRFNYRFNPATYLEKVSCPVLSLNGSKDIQVPSKINQDAIKVALEKGGNMNYKIIELEGLNHTFQPCKTCSMTESKDIEQTFSPDALQIIANWIVTITNPLKK